MSDLDYETLFNDIMVQTRDKRKTLKEVLDRVFEDDSGRTAEVLTEMMRVNEKAQAIETSRPGFMSLMSAMRSVRAVREELLEKVDRLMDEIRRFLALKEELANDRLEKLTTLFREELGNPQFRFHFHLLDDQELHHLSEVRSNARKETGQSSETPVLPRERPSETPRAEAARPPPEPRVQRDFAPTPEPRVQRDFASPPEPRVQRDPVPPPPEPRAEPAAPPPPRETSLRDLREPARPVAPPEPEPEPQWAASAPAAGGLDESSWSAPAEDARPSWLSQPMTESNPPTIRGPAPDPMYAQDHEPAPEAHHEPEAEASGAASPYEVDVDVLRILSEETFRPPKR